MLARVAWTLCSPLLTGLAHARHLHDETAGSSSGVEEVDTSSGQGPSGLPNSPAHSTEAYVNETPMALDDEAPASGVAGQVSHEANIWIGVAASVLAAAATLCILLAVRHARKVKAAAQRLQHDLHFSLSDMSHSRRASSASPTVAVNCKAVTNPIAALDSSLPAPHDLARSSSTCRSAAHGPFGAWHAACIEWRENPSRLLTSQDSRRSSSDARAWGVQTGAEPRRVSIDSIHADLCGPAMMKLRSSSLRHHLHSQILEGEGSVVAEGVSEPLEPGQPAVEEGLCIYETLGRGGFGKVYHGIWRDEEVAIKVVNFSPARDTSRTAFADTEADISLSLHHPHVVATYTDYVSAPSGRRSHESIVSENEASSLVLIQEFCNGGSLGDAVARGCFGSAWRTPSELFAWTRVVDVLIQIAAAMTYVHAKGVVHGDLSSHNVLLKYDRDAFASVDDACASSGPSSCVVAKIADFGLAQRVPRGGEEAPASEACSGPRMGTPFFMAPEVCARRRSGRPADMYAFGVIMWELMGGCTIAVPKDSSLHESSASCAMDGLECALPYARHPAFPTLPDDTPLSYTLLLTTCLSERVSDRLNFEQVTQVLEDMHTEIESGQYVNSVGALREARASAVC